MKRLIAVIISVLLLVCLVGRGDSTNTNGVPDPEKIVPKRDALMENLEDSKYEMWLSVLVSKPSFAAKRKLVIPSEVKRSRGIYAFRCHYRQNWCQDPSTSLRFARMTMLYMMQNNGLLSKADKHDHVYCVSDKTTFRKAGFTTTAKVILQVAFFDDCLCDHISQLPNQFANSE